MEYRNFIDPELRKISIKVPYNKFVVYFGNIFQRISFKLAKISKDIINRSITVKGYKGLSFKVEIFEPSDIDDKLPCLIYMHGGAFSYKAAAYHKKLAAIYAKESKCKVYFPDYHLSPKYKYPAAYEDIVSLYKYIQENSEELNIDINKIGLAGDSAGAELAALVCNNYEVEGLKKPILQMLVYPVTDISMETDSMNKFSDTPLWNSKNNERMWLYYCDGKNESASPMHSILPKEIPSTYIETAEFDCLHDEGILYADKLRCFGADVVINETKGTIHGYDLVINSKIALSNIEKRVLFLNKYMR